MTCELLSEDTKFRLPSRVEMHNNIDAKLEEKRRLYGNVGRHTIVENYMAYLDDLAEIIDIKPRPLEYFISDPKLAVQLIFGPFLPYQFRLRGRKPWPGARDAIVTIWDRVWYSTKKSIGNREDIDECSCPKEHGCLIKRSVNRMNYCVVFVIFMLLMFLVVVF